MAKKTVHLSSSEDIVRSVLKGHPVTAACGSTTTHTRESVDRIPDEIERGTVKICTRCLAEVNGMDGEVTISPARGWLDLLERVWVAQHDAQVSAMKITVRAADPFPLAG